MRDSELIHFCRWGLKNECMLLNSAFAIRMRAMRQTGASQRRRLILLALIVVAAYRALYAASWALNAWEYHRLPMLHRAAYDGDAATCERLVKGGFPVDATDVHGDTALHWAIYRGQVDVVRTLIFLHADTSKPDHLGRTPLTLTVQPFRGHKIQASEVDRAEIARLLKSVSE